MGVVPSARADNNCHMNQMGLPPGCAEIAGGVSAVAHSMCDSFPASQKYFTFTDWMKAMSLIGLLVKPRFILFIHRER